MLELITITTGGEHYKGRYIKHLKTERYDRQGDIRTCTCIETHGRQAWKTITILGLNENDKFYHPGRMADIPYKDASKMQKEMIKLTEKARESYGAGCRSTTYYF